VPTTPRVIGPGDLPHWTRRRPKYLFRTRHSIGDWGGAYDPAHVGLSVEAAKPWPGAGVNLVGIDYLDVEAGAESRPRHRDNTIRRAKITRRTRRFVEPEY